MINAHFERCVVAFILVITGQSGGLAQQFANIAWSRVDGSNECTKFIFDMPASLVPLYSKGTPALDPIWRSFDGKIGFTVSDNINPGYLNVGLLSRSQYVKWGRCSDADERLSRCWESSRILAKASVSKDNCLGNRGALCMEVDAVAPDKSNDRSRFAAMIQMCGPTADNKLIRASVDRILRSRVFLLGMLQTT